MGRGDRFGTMLAEVIGPDLGTSFRNFLWTPFAWADESGISFWQPGRLPTLPLFQGHPDGRFPQLIFMRPFGGATLRTANTLPCFPPTTLSINSTRTSRRTSISPFSCLATRSSADLGWTIGVQPVPARRWCPTKIDALVTGALGTDRLCRSEQAQRHAYLVRRSAPQLSWKSNSRANNFMIYTRGGVP